MAKRIVREAEAYYRIGYKRSKFRRDLVLTDPDDPYIPFTRIKRLRPIPLGVRNHGFLESEIDTLIDALVALRDAPIANPGKQPVPARLAGVRERERPRKPPAATAAAAAIK